MVMMMMMSTMTTAIKDDFRKMALLKVLYVGWYTDWSVCNSLSSTKYGEVLKGV